MCLQLREALATKRIVLAKEFFSSTGVAEAKQQLESEMRFFSVITEAPKTPFGKVRGLSPCVRVRSGRDVF